MTDVEVKLRLAISRVDGLGPRFFLKILEKFNSIEKFLNLSDKEILESLNINPEFLLKIRKETNLEKAKKIIKNISKFEIRFLVYGQKDYPLFLKEIYDPPIAFYYRGEITKISKDNCVSVVGTRRITSYGRKVTDKIVAGLVDRGFTIVSGLAFGIDKVAHKTALDRQGKTVAVLAGDLRKATPRAHQAIFEEIIQKGVVISENYFSDKIKVGSFPRRNRIIAGLSLATIVIEAGEKSGALITAMQAFQENREVFAVPGNIDNFNSVGTNNLIKNERAKLITSAEDVISMLGFSVSKKQDITDLLLDLDEVSKKIVEVIRISPKSEFDLINEVGVESSVLFSLLTKLELKGIIERREDGNFYINL